jgi:dolichol-phosphate mannosyltransferase
MARAETMVTVVAPIQGDASTLRPFVAEVGEVLRARYAHHEIVLVDDGSADEVASACRELLLEQPDLRVIRLSRRFGLDVAVTAGLDSAVGDFAVVMRPRSDPPGEIPEMIRKASGGHAIVLGTSPRAASRGPLVQWGRRLYFWAARKATGHAPPFDATGFSVLPRPAINAITRVKSKHRHLGFLSCTVGFDVVNHPYVQVDRCPTRGLRPLREAVDEAVADLVTNSFIPLRLATGIGAFAALLNLAYVGYIIGVNLVKRRVAEGWTTLSLQQSVMFFFLFMTLVILSEYIVRILQESQDRPLYHVLDDRTSTARDVDAERRNVA